MGKSAPSAPAAPDPVATSAAQTASNKETALYNFGLNNPNVSSPLGSMSYTLDQSDPNAPRTSQTINLSPAEQQLLNQYESNTTQQGAVAGTALNNVQGLMSTPYDLSGHITPLMSQTDQQGDLKGAQDALYHQQTQYLDPQFAQQQEQLGSQLANQGIPMGSAAYQTAMDNFARQKQSAYQGAMDSATSGGAAYQAQLAQTGLAGQQQQAQMYTQQYQEPLNLYSSLISGTQPNMPQFGGVNTSSAAPTNVLGAYQNQYNGQLNAYNAQVGSTNSANAGTTGLIGAGVSAAAILI